MMSVTFYGLLAYLVWHSVKNKTLRWRLIVLLILWMHVIGFSRIYLRAHWFSDVVGGFLLGLAYTSVCLTIYLWRRQWAAHRNPV